MNVSKAKVDKVRSEVIEISYDYFNDSLASVVR